MKLRTNSPTWFQEDGKEKEAKCTLFPATPDNDPWFSEDEDEMGEATAICHGTYDGKPCPLIEQCLEFALSNNERFGIWGGTTPTDRVEIRKERRNWRKVSSEKVGQSQQEI